MVCLLIFATLTTVLSQLRKWRCHYHLYRTWPFFRFLGKLFVIEYAELEAIKHRLMQKSAWFKDTTFWTRCLLSPRQAIGLWKTEMDFMFSSMYSRSAVCFSFYQSYCKDLLLNIFFGEEVESPYDEIVIGPPPPLRDNKVQQTQNTSSEIKRPSSKQKTNFFRKCLLVIQKPYWRKQGLDK